MTLSMSKDFLDLPDELVNAFEKFAKIKGTSKEALILSALEEWLEDQEDIAIADEVIADIRVGMAKILSSEEARDKAGLDNSEEDIADKTIFYLPRERWQAFIEALDAPSKPNKELAKLLATPAPWEK